MFNINQLYAFAEASDRAPLQQLLLFFLSSWDFFRLQAVKKYSSFYDLLVLYIFTPQSFSGKAVFYKHTIPDNFLLLLFLWISGW